MSSYEAYVCVRGSSRAEQDRRSVDIITYDVYSELDKVYKMQYSTISITHRSLDFPALADRFFSKYSTIFYF